MKFLQKFLHRSGASAVPVALAPCQVEAVPVALAPCQDEAVPVAPPMRVHRHCRARRRMKGASVHSKPLASLGVLCIIAP